MLKQKREDIRYICLVFILLLLKILYTDWIMDNIITLGALVTSIGFLLIFLSISFLFNQKGSKRFLYFINILISVLLFSDLLYYKYFHSPLTFHIFYQVNNLSGLGPSVVSLIDFRHLVLVLDLVLLPFFISRKNWYVKINKRLFVVMIVIGLLLLMLKPVKNQVLDHINNFEKDDALSYIRNWGPIGHHVLDAFYYVKDGQDLHLSTNNQKEIDKWFSQKQSQLSNSSPYTGIAKDMNLIMIQVESLQNFVIGKSIEGQEITPNINSLLKHSIYFPKFYPQTIEGNSSDAELLTNTSLYPIKQGSTFFRFPNNTYPSLGAMLKTEGYSTFAIHGDEGEFWNRKEVYPQLGFDEYFDLEHFRLDEEIGMGLSDRSMFQQSIPILKTKSEPFYAFYITLTSHIPFIIPDDQKGLQLDQKLDESLIGNYYQSIHYVDQAIGEFVDELNKNHLLENTMIVIYGDHDGIHKKDLKEVEEWVADKEITDQEWIETYMPVPFLIYNPTLSENSISTIGGQIDVLPTLSDLYGIYKPNAQKYMMGQNLFTTKNPYAIIPSGDYAERAYIDNQKTQIFLDQKHQKILDIADLIIRGNYFKSKLNH